MAQLHEILAVEKNTTAQYDKNLAETAAKFKKVDSYFVGRLKTLQMIADSPENKAIEAAAREEKRLVTNVVDTLDYTLDLFAKAEDVQYQKNRTNQKAVADIELNGTVIATNVPIDELMGLQARLEKIRGILNEAPSLDASARWERDSDRTWKLAEPRRTSKTEKEVFPIVLAPATDKHPAQVKEGSRDKTVGTFEEMLFSGALHVQQKADVMQLLDNLIQEIRRARTRANQVEIERVNIGQQIKSLILGAITNAKID